MDTKIRIKVSGPQILPLSLIRQQTVRPLHRVSANLRPTEKLSKSWTGTQIKWYPIPILRRRGSGRCTGA